MRIAGLCFIRENAIKWLGIRERGSELLCCELAVLIIMSNWNIFYHRTNGNVKKKVA